jgi:EpsI family protein
MRSLARPLALGQWWAVVAILCATAITYFPGTQDLLALWTDYSAKGNTHGPLIVAVCIGLLFRDRAALAAEPARFSRGGLLGLILCSAAWLVCWRANIRDLYLLLFPALVFFAVYAAYGPGVALRVAFVIDFLVFALPFWDWFAGPLQHLTVLAMTVLLKATGVHAFIEGIRIELPSGSFAVERSCSGAHFFVVGLAVAALLGELNRDTLRRRALLLVGMGIAAIVANWVRVYTVVLAGYLTDMQHYLVRVEHYRFGWGVFAVFVVLFILIADRLPPSRPAQPAPDRAATADNVGSLKGLGFVAAVFAVTAFIWISAQARDGVLKSELRLAFPKGADGWSDPLPQTNSDWQPLFVGSAGELRARYAQSQGAVVEVFMAAYAGQRQGGELIGYPNTLLNPSSLASESEGEVVTNSGTFHEIVTVDARGSRSVIWSTYVIGRHAMTAELPAQLRYGVGSLLKSELASVVAYRARCQGSCDAARETLKAFAQSMNARVLQAASIHPDHADAGR